MPGKDGAPGLQGPPGIRGQTGMPGVQGPPGRSITDSEIRDICASVLRGRYLVLHQIILFCSDKILRYLLVFFNIIAILWKKL